MIAGALGSALSGSFWVLIGFRFLLGSGVSGDVAWRVLLALGAVPAAVVIYLRCRMPESPRAADRLPGYFGGAGWPIR
jgi:hypothetical protein